MHRQCEANSATNMTKRLLTDSFEDVVVIGGGKYGSKAVKALRGRARRIVVIDNDPQCPARPQSDRACSLGDHISFADGISFIAADGSSTLLRIFSSGIVPDYVVPSIPQNVMAQLFRAWTASKGLEAIPDPKKTRSAGHSLSKEVLAHTDAEKGHIIVSFSNGKTCSPLCLEGGRCPLSGEPRPMSMFRILSAQFKGGACKIFQSHLLAPEVGGIEGDDIADAFNSLLPKLHNGAQLAIGTACMCHGTIDFMLLKHSSKV